MTEQVFKETPSGTLMHIDPDTNQLQVWFPYTTSLVQKVKKGAFVAVKNFDSNSGDKDKFTLLEIMEAMPTHYALGSSKNAIEKTFPGFMEEAAKNAKTDWEQDEPKERTTYIKCTCEKAGRAISFNEAGEWELVDNEALPMVGEDAKILSNEMVDNVVNEGLGEGNRSTITPANLRLDEDIPFKLEVEGLLKTHFGIFGFTGAGKSNLMSNIVGKVVESDSDASIVFSDLMGEYLVLMLDLLDKLDEAYVVYLSEDSVPGGDDTIAYLEGEEDKLDDAAQGILNTLIVPREISDLKQNFKPLIKDLLESDKFRFIKTENIYRRILLEELDSIVGDNPNTAEHNTRLRIQERFDEDESLGEEELQDFLEKLKIAVNNGGVPSEPDNWDLTEDDSGMTQDSLKDDSPAPATDEVEFDSDTDNVSKTQRNNLREFIYYLEDVIDDISGGVGQNISRTEIMDKLDKDSSSLIVISSDDQDELKQETSRLMRMKYNQRKRRGEKDPLVSFIFDEADEYIPQNTDDESTARVKNNIEEIARRGRKFGIGIGIATQRATYLDTNIMAQPHTYLISKLPREADRDNVGEAFGISDEVLDKTLDFNTGEWLSVSFEAMGMSGFPIPAKFDNANDRIRNYVEEED